MREVFLIRYGEIGTKSRRTRSRFIRRLIRNISDGLRSEGIKDFEIENLWSRIILRSGPKAEEVLRRIFGISSFSPAFEVKTDLEEIISLSLKIFPREAKKFRVSCQRLWKGFDLTSIEVNRVVGEEIRRELGKEVDLERPEVEIGIEILEGSSYIFLKKIRGLGGLPIGVEGNLLGVVRDKFEALNVLLGMRRGASVAYVSTKRSLIEKISKFSYGNDFEGILSEKVEDLPKIEAEGILIVPRSLEELKELKRKYSLPVYDLVSYLPEEKKRELLDLFSLA